MKILRLPQGRYEIVSTVYMAYYTTAQGISFLFFNSAVSKAYWLVEHAGSVCYPWCWNMCCISGADCRAPVEKTIEEFVDRNQVRYWVKRKKKHYIIDSRLVDSILGMNLCAQG